MPLNRLPYNEWLQRKKVNVAKQIKRRKSIRNYLIKHNIDGHLCKRCKREPRLGAITRFSIRFFCEKCKIEWFIKIELPRLLVPKKYFKKEKAIPKPKTIKIKKPKPLTAAQQKKKRERKEKLDKKIIKILSGKIDLP